VAEPSPRIRPTLPQDVPAIVALLVDDPIGRRRETLADLETYRSAFAALTGKTDTHLLVAEDEDKLVIGYLQVTVTQHLSYRCAKRALLEDLRVASSSRGRGVGRQLVQSAIRLAQSVNCKVVQLFVHQSRDRARRFYHSLGFETAHDGLRLTLD
jgi:ribosomal protein S18 acetylase RimI-like enzyme